MDLEQKGIAHLCQLFKAHVSHKPETEMLLLTTKENNQENIFCASPLVTLIFIKKNSFSHK